MSASRVEREITTLAEAAQGAAADAFRGEAMASLDRLVGIDLGLCWSIGTPAAPTLYQVATAAAELIARRHAAFLPTLTRLFNAAAAQGGVVLDARLFSPREMAGLPLYHELGGCLGARQHMTLRLAVRGRPVAGLYLGRTGRARAFTDDDVALVGRLVPVLSLAEAAPPPDAADAADAARSLTAREREVLELFAVGASYAEVGRALGVSINTIRQHVRAIYEKLHVASKVEAVMRLRR